MTKCIWIVVLFVAVLHWVTADTDPVELKEREDKLFSIFTIVRFPNDACRASNGDNGTCLTSTECSSDGGTSSGSCASGFGVCCIFKGNCGGTTNKNCTYFENPGTSLNEATSCTFQVNKCSDNICQLRLDFDNFVTAQPDGTAVTANTGQCNTDAFRVSGGPNGSFGPICGTNTGQHIYYDVGRGAGTCSLSFSTTTDTFDRTWKIKISQIPCCSELMAPPGCDQYYTGTNGKIQSYNWMTENNAATGIHLQNQKQNICVRPERGYCSIRYSVDTTVTDTSFNVLTNPAVQSANQADCTLDYLIVPCGTGQTTAETATLFCGERFSATAGGGAADNEVVQSIARMFMVTFVTDNDEANDAGGNGYQGFRLCYAQQPC